MRSPYLRLAYVEEVARVCPDVRVGVLEDGSGQLAFWPFQQKKPGIARPVGEKIGCLHGVVCSEAWAHDGEEMVRAAGMRSWRFDHQIVSQKSFSRFMFQRVPAPFMDLRGGFDAYCERRRDNGRGNKAIRKARAGQRKLEREQGAVRFEVDSRDPELLGRVIDWKRRQMRSTGIGDLFRRSPWILEFTENVLRRSEDEFRGMMSVLHAGGNPVSIFFGLRSGTVFHGLFFAYDPRYARYSPGRILLANLARHGAKHGLERVELGKGNEPYKASFATGSTDVAVGSIDLQPVNALIWNSTHRLKRRIARSPFEGPLRSVKQLANRLVDRGSGDGMPMRALKNSETKNPCCFWDGK
ncbi:MAG: GNAT family N-acetyltransferase [Verrucomicrobiales bacterium]